MKIDDTDRRVVCVTVTKEGKEFLASADWRMNRISRDLEESSAWRRRHNYPILEEFYSWAKKWPQKKGEED